MNVAFDASFGTVRWAIEGTATNAQSNRKRLRDKRFMFPPSGGSHAPSLGRSRIAVVEPRLGGIRISTSLPEPLLVVLEEFDFANPLRAFPCVETRGDHPARTAVLLRQRFSLPGVHQENVVFDSASEGQVRGVRLAGHPVTVVTGAQDPVRIFFRHGKLGDGLESNALPSVIE